MTRARRLSLEELEPYLVKTPADHQQLDPAQLFGNTNPLEIEVGCGKGLFLLNRALALPEVNFLGIEIDRKYQLFAATRVAKRKLSNARFASTDARGFFSSSLPKPCCRAVHVYFPDPWWKTRHRKRRLFTPEFVRACEAVLLPGGQLFIATDVEEYFHAIVKLIAAETRFVPVEAPMQDLTDGAPFATNFERKAQLKGTAVHRVLYQKRG